MIVRLRWLGLAVSLFAGLFVVGGLGSGSAAAAERYVIGVENIAYLPAYSGVNGDYTGFARTLFDRYAKDRGIEFVYKPLPVARLMASLTSGQVDFKFPDNPKWDQAEREGFAVAYSGPVSRYVDGTLVLPVNKGRALDSVKTVGTVAGFSPWKWMGRKQDGLVEIKENADFDSLIRQALAGRVDGAYASVANVTYALEHRLNQPGALVFDPSLPHDDNNYLLSSVKHPEVLADFDAWMKANQAFIAELKADTGVEAGLP